MVLLIGLQNRIQNAFLISNTFQTLVNKRIKKMEHFAVTPLFFQNENDFFKKNYFSTNDLSEMLGLNTGGFPCIALESGVINTVK